MTRKEAIDILHKRLLDMKKTGIILLPDYCEVVVAPKDTEIKVEMEVQNEY